jgi:hypothetical protein
MKIGRGNRSTRRKPAQAPLSPPQIPLDQTWDRTRAAAVGSQWLTASARSYWLGPNPMGDSLTTGHERKWSSSKQKCKLQHWIPQANATSLCFHPLFLAHQWEKTTAENKHIGTGKSKLSNTSLCNGGNIILKTLYTKRDWQNVLRYITLHQMHGSYSITFKYKICLLIMTYQIIREKELTLILQCLLQIICSKMKHKAYFSLQTPSCLPDTQQAGKPLQNTEK